MKDKWTRFIALLLAALMFLSFTTTFLLLAFGK